MSHVKKVFSPPINKKSTRNPIINPIYAHRTINAAKMKAHAIAKTINMPEKEIPCKKYLSNRDILEYFCILT